MELSRALQCQPSRVLKGHPPFASAGLPRALWPSRRCEVFRLAGLARPGESLPWPTHPAAPHSDAWPHCVLERRCLLLLLLAAAQPAAQAAAGAGALFVDRFWKSFCIYLDTRPQQALAELKRHPACSDRQCAGGVCQ